MKSKKKSILCHLGWHSWFIDSAYFYSADCCNRCLEYKDPERGKLLRKERQLFKETREQDLDREEALLYVMKRIKDEEN